MDNIKVFDFDNTLYHGESSIDLAFYLIRRNKRILLYVPSILINLAKYKMCIVDREKAEQEINDFLKIAVKDKYEAAEIVESFWAENIHRLDHNIIKRVGKEDVIITAGPDMLINAIKDKLGTENIISSVIDPDKREMVYFNFGENKAKRYKEVYGDTPIDSFYTDSFNDKPLMKLANNVYIVEKGRLKKMTEQGKAKL
ncbi:MAG: haloacid dehalogenase-like hydrolase [Ruminococcus sp.]|uniref:haloacid dehalogenase-like hydrolase n=1 Tax=Ruminococcus sp. TaxID=41978 RepID=UPI002600A305|nr:haloacid dehalogenase-like hydrolase [Ruminococcus sp.]MBO4865794.1 haloacid dehalogenase-like hydrolase [Ruminococcus sp.]